ncbi:MAG: nitroreductase family protein [Planctomycetales bacterium]|nr:nitroreductase family protein [Planctomycetales bacterium]
MPYDQKPLQHVEVPPDEMKRRAAEFNRLMQARRTVRQFSDRHVDAEIIRNCIQAAGSAPSGANQQPWHFVVVQDSETKHKIRVAAEEEERAFYAGRASDEWLDAVQPLGTDANKPFLEIAPYVIAVFAQPYAEQSNGTTAKHYYVSESVGIATGILITGLHQAGLATLTHTPAPMKFLNQILDRPDSERPYLMLVVGYPSTDATVPDIQRKPFDEICSWR